MISKDMMKDLKILQTIIGFKFKNIWLLYRALTHSSYANEHGLESNERLEFLGDSVLGLAVSDYLFEQYPSHSEGELTQMRSLIVSDHSLAKVANNIKLGDYLLLGRGEDKTGGRRRDSILADGVEAIIGAAYIDRGFQESADFVIKTLSCQIDKITDATSFKDYKTELQEYVQRISVNNIKYIPVEEQGPDHAKYFVVNALHEEKFLGSGKGRSKKEAEQNAAKVALDFLKNRR